MRKEPPRLEILITKNAFIFFGKAIYKEFADRLPLSGSEQVLDFGSGMGTVAYYVAKRLPQGNLTCQDISERWLSACRKTLKRYKNVTITDADAADLPAGNFDVVYCHFVLHEIADSELASTIPALARALKQGGYLVFKEPLAEADKLRLIKKLVCDSGLTFRSGRVTDLPFMGNALECVYTK
ncbi:MAG: class I SAM-dependent methyltransferase [Clostridiales bacterium]|jgi:ubiquinone/menaquinone biosynthesis C-methylase UbiE|nr:class I SAM-dependent methyltransferase [Clostridiales bacterium]HOB64903.1 class I SAM-dependent methyltransferase [Clostridia bacterium]HOK81645.1 class I SAM-dependent methyltransferase [Clostridia bacterium]HOL60542.1 class I SAM-dependent methyltransferase [Clostridia bacterium]HPO52949.1 class I SAM-dependent methyltransferase [Clostridia bacterium]